MLAGLFEGEDNSNGVTEFPSITDRSGQLPLPPRLASRLCGIYNQGATCYMNSLLQTLLMTPEFRGEFIINLFVYLIMQFNCAEIYTLQTS